jgi:lysophospholipase L1-like esterase
VDALDVERTGPGSIVVLGDSITDGFNATTNWVRVLQQRVDRLPAPEQRAVVDEGITANALTSDVPTDSKTGGGPSGLARLTPDVLDQPGVSEVVVFLGTNDLWFGDTVSAWSGSHCCPGVPGRGPGAPPSRKSWSRSTTGS